MTKAERERYYLASKLWRGGEMMGWAYPHWPLSQKDKSILEYFERHEYVEKNGLMLRLTQAGRSALGVQPIPS